MGSDQLDGFVAASGLADDLIPLLLHDLLEVEADDGLVFCDHETDCHGPRSLRIGQLFRTAPPPSGIR